MPPRRHKGVRREKLHLPYSPDLGVHHLFYEGRHYTRGYEHNLRNFGAFILNTSLAPPPQHTLIHRSLDETPKPSNEECYDLLHIAKRDGLEGVVDQIDSRTTDHLRRQLAILAMPFDEAVERLSRKMYVTDRELTNWI